MHMLWVVAKTDLRGKVYQDYFESEVAAIVERGLAQREGWLDVSMYTTPAIPSPLED